MKALIGKDELQGSSSKELATKYISESIISSSKGFLFLSKYEILSQPNLLFALGKELMPQLVDDEPVTTCVLASSGLPIGIATAIMSKHPIMFFRRLGFPKYDGTGIDGRIRPTSRPVGKIILLDAYERSRYTSATCFKELEVFADVQPVRFVVPFSFDICIKPEYTQPTLDYFSLVKLTDVIDTICENIGEEKSMGLLDAIANPRSAFWSAPPYPQNDNPYSEFKAPGIRRRAKYFVGRGVNLSVIEPIDSSLETICEHIVVTDEGVWDFFSDPEFVADFATRIGQKLRLNDYDCLLGVSYLGTALAIALAYHNQDSFSGRIISYLGEEGLLPRPVSLANLKILPLEMRLTNGTYAVDVYERVRKLGGTIDQYVMIFPPSEPNDLFEQSRQTSIARLIDRGVRFRRISR